MEADDISARLLPLDSWQSTHNNSTEAKWSPKNVVLYLLLVVNLTTPVIVFLPNQGLLRTPGSDQPAAPQWADALQAAERAASQWCSGNGYVFVDTVNMDAEGSPSCECNDCFAGPDCSLRLPDCVANVESGDPLLFEAYWRQNSDLGVVVIPAWYRMGYKTQDAATTFFTDALIALVRDLHSMVGNAVTEGRYIALGTGSTQLINAVIHGLALQDPDRVTPVVSKVPYYNAYYIQTEYFKSTLYSFSGEPDRKVGQQGPLQIEVIASPNNPDTQIQEVPQNVSGHVVYDHAYYWPHLTPITKAVDYDIMLFTLSKVTGHAGSRIGWVILKDFDLYTKVMRYVDVNTVGVGHEAQLRASQLIRSIIKGHSEANSGRESIFQFGYEVLQSRWARLQIIFQNVTRFSLQEMNPGYCSFFKRVSDPSPGYAWVHCNRDEDADCHEVLLSAGIIGRPGPVFGATPRYVRLSLLKRASHFDNLADHLLKLIAQP